MATEENVARSIMSSSWVAKEKGRIKHNAYLPAPDDDTSVFRCTHLSAHEVRDLMSADRLTEHGAAVVQVGVIKEAGLQAVASEPPKRHVNIRGWPNSPDPEEQKARRKEAAKVIAESAWHMPWPRV